MIINAIITMQDIYQEKTFFKIIGIEIAYQKTPVKIQFFLKVLKVLKVLNFQNILPLSLLLRVGGRMQSIIPASRKAHAKFISLPRASRWMMQNACQN